MMRTTINRVLLALTGIIALGGGLLVLAGGAGIYRHWNLTPPSGWPLSSQHDVLIPHGDQTRWAGQDWWWPATIASLSLALLLALAWLLAQIPRGRQLTLHVGGRPQPAVRLDDNALSDALTEDLGNLTGVRHARASLSGSRRRPHVHIDLTLAPDSAPTHVLGSVAEATERARQSIGQDVLPTQIHLKIAGSPAHRAD